MSDETTYQFRQNRSRHAIASYLHRVADALEDGASVAVAPDGEESRTIQPPAESMLDVEVERDGAGHVLEIELAWDDELDASVDDRSDATFELYADAADEYRWRLRHRNGNIIADSGEGYTERREADAAIERVRERVGPAQYLRADPTAYEVYQDSADEWRWRLIHKNGQILADGGEGYASRSGARDAVDRVRTALESGDEYEFEVFEDEGGKYRWRLEASNGEIVADSGQGFSEERGANQSIERVEGHSADAAVLDIGLAAFEVFEDKGGKYRWRLRHRNGNILADGGQGYSSRTKAFDGIDSVKRNAPNAEQTDA